MLQTLGLAYDRFDSVGNRDYTTAPNSTRGGQVYYPPNGWKRYGVKVQTGAWRGKTNGPGEWPVSYHGTSIENARSIIAGGYAISMSKCGGTFSAQVLATAQGYCKQFVHEKRGYFVILVNRVNVQEATLNGSPGSYVYVGRTNQATIPYGLLIKAV